MFYMITVTDDADVDADSDGNDYEGGDGGGDGDEKLGPERTTGRKKPVSYTHLTLPTSSYV